MPRGARHTPSTAPAEPTPTFAEDEDYSQYAEKDPTDKMVWFHTWAQEATGLKLDLKSLSLGPTLYHFFQASDYNKEMTAQKRAAREAASASNGAAETEDEAPPKTTRRTRQAKAETAEDEKPATGRGRGRPRGSGTASGKSTPSSKPATTGRRGRGAAAKSGAAPF